MIKLELTVEEIDKVLGALLELPARFSMDLINKIRGEAMAQLEQAGKEQGAECQK